ncbi:hypothetical protein HMPREF1980_01796 [Actinomyces sp. oral taxon 172 str. F0311]|nr:hypothetical protein HMPREF1980_01796 [Actinomyces sp. oral taxon 172 str. F0311]
MLRRGRIRIRRYRQGLNRDASRFLHSADTDAGPEKRRIDT